MGKKIDLTGQSFGRWIVIKEDPIRAKDKRIKWICQCSCDKKTIKSISGTSLRMGTSVSCGCYQKEQSKKSNIGNTYGRANIKDISQQKKGQLTPIERLQTKAKNNSYEWICICDCGNQYIANTADLNAGRKTRCDECSKNNIISKGEALIIELLELNKIEYIYQKTFPTCIFPMTQTKLKFDFYIPKENYLIEFDGEQHFKISESSKWKEKNQTLKQRDNIKNQWCKENNIPLIRIPYTHLNKLNIKDLKLSESEWVV